MFPREQVTGAIVETANSSLTHNSEPFFLFSVLGSDASEDFVGIPQKRFPFWEEAFVNFSDDCVVWIYYISDRSFASLGKQLIRIHYTKSIIR